MLMISVFSALQPQSGSVANRGGTVADPRAQEADRLEREATVPSAAPGSRPFEDLLAPVGAGREPVHFNAYPLATLVVRGLILIPADPSRSRLRVEMPDGTVGDARLGDHLGVEDLKITDITATEVVLENWTRIAFRREE
jgi:hypothetical protein